MLRKLGFATAQMNYKNHWALIIFFDSRNIMKWFLLQSIVKMTIILTEHSTYLLEKEFEHKLPNVLW